MYAKSLLICKCTKKTSLNQVRDSLMLHIYRLILVGNSSTLPWITKKYSHVIFHKLGSEAWSRSVCPSLCLSVSSQAVALRSSMKLRSRHWDTLSYSQFPTFRFGVTKPFTCTYKRTYMHTYIQIYTCEHTDANKLWFSPHTCHELPRTQYAVNTVTMYTQQTHTEKRKWRVGVVRSHKPCNTHVHHVPFHSEQSGYTTLQKTSTHACIYKFRYKCNFSFRKTWYRAGERAWHQRILVFMYMYHVRFQHKTGGRSTVHACVSGRSTVHACVGGGSTVHVLVAGAQYTHVSISIHVQVQYTCASSTSEYRQGCATTLHILSSAGILVVVHATSRWKKAITRGRSDLSVQSRLHVYTRSRVTYVHGN